MTNPRNIASHGCYLEKSQLVDKIEILDIMGDIIEVAPIITDGSGNNTDGSGNNTDGSGNNTGTPSIVSAVRDPSTNSITVVVKNPGANLPYTLHDSDGGAYTNPQTFDLQLEADTNTYITIFNPTEGDPRLTGTVYLSDVKSGATNEVTLYDIPAPTVSSVSSANNSVTLNAYLDPSSNTLSTETNSVVCYIVYSLGDSALTIYGSGHTTPSSIQAHDLKGIYVEGATPSETMLSGTWYVVLKYNIVVTVDIIGIDGNTEGVTTALETLYGPVVKGPVVATTPKINEGVQVVATLNATDATLVDFEITGVESINNGGDKISRYFLTLYDSNDSIVLDTDSTEPTFIGKPGLNTGQTYKWQISCGNTVGISDKFPLSIDSQYTVTNPSSADTVGAVISGSGTVDDKKAAIKTAIQTNFAANPVITVNNIDISQLVTMAPGLPSGITASSLINKKTTIAAPAANGTVGLASDTLAPNTVLYIMVDPDIPFTIKIDGVDKAASFDTDKQFLYDGQTYAPGSSVTIGTATLVYAATGSGAFVNNSSSSGVICFTGNAPVLTPSGYRRIDSLREGDLVQTADGRSVAIQRVAHQRVAASAAVNPYVIERGQFGATRRLLISPEHRVAVAGRGLIEARHLGLKQEECTGTLDYYNLELPNWKNDNMVVAGVEAESLAPVRRIVMTQEAFRTLIHRQYGAMTPAIEAKILRTCKFLSGGRVEVPAMRR